MLRNFIFCSLVVLLFSHCNKKDEYVCNFDACGIVAPDAEVQMVQTYLNSNNITTATKHCSGMFYEILTPGTGAAPDACTDVNVYYVGKQTNGATFESGTTDLSLREVIRGWSVGLPLIKEGGKIKLYIPPTLGYGNRQHNTLPPNSVLIFEVTLNKVY